MNVTTFSLPPNDMDALREVARLIAGQNPPNWLVPHLRRWTNSLWLDRHVEVKQLGRSEARSRLQNIQDLADELLTELRDAPLREFLAPPALGSNANWNVLDALLADVSERAQRAAGALSTDNGKTRAGRGKAMPPGAFSPLVYCAIIIAETWKYFRHNELPPRSPRAADAAAAYWRAAGGGNQHSWGNEPKNRWHHHFKKAQEQPAEDIRAEYRRHLRESAHQAELLASSSAPAF